MARRRSRRRSRRARARGPLTLLTALLVALAAVVGSGTLSLPVFPGAPVERLSERQVSWTAWDPAADPDYYRVIGTAVVDVELAPGEVRYEGLDELGRTGRVAAMETPEMEMPEENALTTEMKTPQTRDQEESAIQEMSENETPLTKRDPEKTIKI